MVPRIWMAACISAGLTCVAQFAVTPYRTAIFAGAGPANGSAATTVGLYDVAGTATDAAGNFYYTSATQSRIYRITAAGTISVVAGTGIRGFLGDNGPAVDAQLSSPGAIAVDASGNIYFADTGNLRIRKISADGRISTFAGTGEMRSAGLGPARLSAVGSVRSLAVDGAGNLYVGGDSDVRKIANGVITRFAGTGDYGYGGDNGPATSAQLGWAWNLGIDSAGNVYICDSGNSRVRKVSGGVITTVAGNGTYDANAADGSIAVTVGLAGCSAMAVDSAGNIFLSTQGRVRKVSGGILTTVAGNGNYDWSGTGAASAPGNGGPATQATLASVDALTVDQAGTLYITEEQMPVPRIRKVAGGIISAFAGNGTRGTSGDGGPALTAQTSSLRSMAADGEGNLYIAGGDANRVRKISGGLITTVAGGGTMSLTDGIAATSAQMSPGSVALDGFGNVYISDWLSRQIHKLSQGKLSRFAGTGRADYTGDGGPALNAAIGDSARIAADAAGNVYVSGQNRIRKISGGNISLLAGAGPQDGAAGASISVEPVAAAADAAGNLYLAARAQHKVFKIAPNGTVSTVAGDGTSGFSGDSGPAAAAQLSYPSGVAVDALGSVYIADGNQRIRKVSAGIITTVVGGGSGCPQQVNTSGDGCTGPSASVTWPGAIAVDAAGTVYFSDGYRVRKLSAGIVSAVAGGSDSGFTADGTAASASLFGFVAGLATDASGNVYVADSGNRRVRKIAANVVTTVAGNGETGPLGDSGPATSVGIIPAGLAVDGSGNLYIADAWNLRVRKVAGGVMSTVAGGGPWDGSQDNVPATQAALSNPVAVAADGAGNVYIADTGLYRVRKVSLSGTILTVAGNGYRSSSGDNGPALRAQFDDPTAMAVDTAGTLYVAESSRVRAISPAGTVTTVYESPGRRWYGGPTGVTADGRGNVFVADATPPGQLYRVSGGAVVPFVPMSTTSNFGSYNYPGGGGLASDGKGTVYAEDGSGIIRAFTPAGGTCNYGVRFDPAPVVAAEGGPVTLLVDTMAGCPWSLSPSLDWVVPTSLASGSGPGTLTLAVRPNLLAAARTVVLNVGARSFPLAQAGAGCNVALSVGSLAPPASGSTGALQITAGCSWSGASSADWIQFFPLNGTGSATTYYTVLPNFGTTARYGTLSINGNVVTVMQPGATGAFRNRFVRLLYYYMFGRMPSQAEEDYQVTYGGSTLDLAKSFFTSQEFANTGKMVAGLYVGLLGRDAEYGGWVFQRNALRSGQFDNVALIQNFITSQEFGLRWGTLNDNQFVRLLYQNMLGRLPSQADEAWQVTNVQRDGRARIAANFTMGVEFRIGRLAQFDSFLAYASLLSRDPGDGERQTTRLRLESGVPIDTILAEIVNSAEFTGLLQ